MGHPVISNSVTVNVYFQGFFRIGIIIVSIKVLIVENVFQAKKRKAYGVMIKIYQGKSLRHFNKIFLFDY